MNPIDEKIREILRKYNGYKKIIGNVYAEDQALAEIKKVWGEMVGEDKQKDYAGGGSDEWFWSELRKEGYNQAKAELRQKVGE